MRSNNSGEKHLQVHTHPLCFICGGLSIRTANLIFKSESWLFFGTTIRCNSADLELLEVGYNITYKRQKRTHLSAQYKLQGLRQKSSIFLFKKKVSCPNVSKPLDSHHNRWVFNTASFIFLTNMCFHIIT